MTCVCVSVCVSVCICGINKKRNVFSESRLGDAMTGDSCVCLCLGVCVFVWVSVSVCLCV